MKHFRPITQAVPARGDVWQDILCQIILVLNALLSSFGGASPLGGFLADKCTIPGAES